MNNSRRSFVRNSIILVGSFAAGDMFPGCVSERTTTRSAISPKYRYPKELSDCSQAAGAKGKWGSKDFNHLINSMDDDLLKLACQTIKLPADQVDYSKVAAMRAALYEKVNSWTGYPFWHDGESNIQYHRDIVMPTAKLMGIQVGNNMSTYHVESTIYQHLLKNNGIQ